VLEESNPATEIPVTLRLQATAPPIQSALWFVGILVPALLTAIIGLWAYRFQKRLDAKETETASLEQFKRDKEADVKSFLTGVYKNSVPLSDEDYRETLEHEFSELRIVYAFPQKARERLLAALKKADRLAVARELAQVFPEHKVLIMEPVTSE
jgi:hypothetical protein